MCECSSSLDGGSSQAYDEDGEVGGRAGAGKSYDARGTRKRKGEGKGMEESWRGIYAWEIPWAWTWIKA